jgi:nucleoside-diphosphate-sugar epimerase
MDDGRTAILLEESHARWRWARGYVDDIAGGVFAAILDDRAAGRVYNIAEQTALTEADWVRAIAGAAGWRGEVLSAPAVRLPPGMRRQLNFNQDLTYDTTRIRTELGYAEGTPGGEGMARTVEWERSHPPDRVDPGDFDYSAEDAALARIVPSEG